MLHQCLAGHLVHINETLLSIITAWSGKYRFSVGFAVDRVIFESLFLIEITFQILLWGFTIYNGFFIYDWVCRIFVEGKVITFVCFGGVSVFGGSLVWGSEIQ
jgi:hypothetical protein